MTIQHNNLVRLQLIITVCLISLGSFGCGSGIKRKVVQNYTLQGSIEIINDCDGKQASIPAIVDVDSFLYINRNKAIPGHAKNVALAPNPAAPNQPTKIGTYKITVRWPTTVMGGPPIGWEKPVVLFNKKDVCLHINNCDNSKTCKNMATSIGNVPVAGLNTNHNITYSCGCVN